MADTPELESVDEIESEIQRLTAALSQRKKALADPEQRLARRICRQQDMGRWAEGLRFSADQIAKISLTQNNHPEIWAAEVMQVDGWTLADNGSWGFPRNAREGGA